MRMLPLLSCFPDQVLNMWEVLRKESQDVKYFRPG